MKLRKATAPFHRSFINRLAKGLSTHSRRADKYFSAPHKEDMEPPSLREVEQEEISIGSAIDEYISDQQEQRSYA